MTLTFGRGRPARTPPSGNRTWSTWAASYQRLSRGRLLLNVVTGGQADEQRRFGDYLSHNERYARTGEFLVRQLHAAYRRSGVASDLEIYPHLEEAYWFGEGVLPELRRRGVWAGPAAGVADRDRVLADRPGN
jgi:hypothetical protein